MSDSTGAAIRQKLFSTGTTSIAPMNKPALAPEQRRRPLSLAPAGADKGSTVTSAREVGIALPRHAAAHYTVDSNGLSITTATSSDDPICCGDASFEDLDVRDPARDVFVLFRWRVARWNASLPAIVMHIWELLAVIALLLSLIDKAIPSSPTLWAPITIAGAGFLYFLLLVLAIFSLPSHKHLKSSETLQRQRRMLNNDLWHFFAGAMVYIPITIFYFIWYYGVAGGAVPVDPLTDTKTYISQQLLHGVLLASTTVIFFEYLLINSVALSGFALAAV